MFKAKELDKKTGIYCAFAINYCVPHVAGAMINSLGVIFTLQFPYGLKGEI